MKPSEFVRTAILIVLALYSQPAGAASRVLTYSEGIEQNATFNVHRRNGPWCRAVIGDAGDPGTPGVEFVLDCERSAAGNRASFDIFASTTLQGGWVVRNVSTSTDADNRHTTAQIARQPAPGVTNPFTQIDLTAPAGRSVTFRVAIDVFNARPRRNRDPLAHCLIGGDRTSSWRWPPNTAAYRCNTGSDCDGEKLVCASDPCGQGKFCAAPLR